jgi:hypothetical protein
MRKFIVGALLAALPMSFVATTAVADPIGSPNQISNFAIPHDSKSCGGPAIAYNPVSGKTLSAWTTNTGGTNAIEVTLVNSDGTGGTIASYSDASVPQFGSCEPVAIGAAPDGGFIVVYDDYSDILGVKVSSSGTFVGSHFYVSSYSYDDYETLDIEWSPDHQKFLVAWSGTGVTTPFPFALADQQLVGRFINASGVGIGDDFLITNISGGYNNSMDLAYGDSVWAVVGTNNTSPRYPQVTFISSVGGLSTPAVCQATPTNSGGATIAYNAAADLFACAWKANPNVLGYNLLDSSGALEFVADVQLTLEGRGKPRVESLGASGWLFTWHGPDSKDIHGVVSDVTGSTLGEIDYVSAGLQDTSVEMNFRPAVAFSPSTGNAYIVWSHNDNVANETEMYSRAWYVREPELAATGFNSLVPASVGAFFMILGAYALSRRRAVA